MQVIFNKFFKYCFLFPHWADSAVYKINNTVMPVLLAGTIEFVHIEQVSAIFTSRLEQVVYLQHSYAFLLHAKLFIEGIANIQLISLVVENSQMF
jgi:hypothetical protein